MGPGIYIWEIPWVVSPISLPNFQHRSTKAPHDLDIYMRCIAAITLFLKMSSLERGGGTAAVVAPAAVMTHLFTREPHFQDSDKSRYAN